MAQKPEYFYVEQTLQLDSIDELVGLNKMKIYYKPGKLYSTSSSIQNNITTIIDNSSHKTAGLFRGQTDDWPLIPSSYRSYRNHTNSSPSEFTIKYAYESNNEQLITFCEHGSKENYDFPKSKIEQMVIAQHYGIETPLLDWSSNIFVAIYFALDLRFSKDMDEDHLPFIYHIIDERLLNSHIDEERIEFTTHSALVVPSLTDRRIERQFSRFSFHPLPIFEISKVPVNKYQLTGKLFMELWHLLDGMGYSSSHFFPDYAGLAERIKQGFMI